MSDGPKERSHEEIVEFLNGNSVVPSGLEVLSEAGYVDEDPVRTTVRRNMRLDMASRNTPNDPPYYDPVTGEYAQDFLNFNSAFLFELRKLIEVGVGHDLDFGSLAYNRGEDTVILGCSSISITLRSTFDQVRDGKPIWKVDYFAYILR
jgi:hypothetical protein